jgi:hypothetical protein
MLEWLKPYLFLFKTENKILDFPVTNKPVVKKTRSKTVAKNGLYANIHKKQERIAKEKAEGKPVEKMRKVGAKGAPTAEAFKQSAKTAKKK